MIKVYNKRTYFERLRDLNIKNGERNLSIFLGAGFSRNFNMPDWKGYAIEKLSLMSKDGMVKTNYSTKEELKQLDSKHLLTLLQVLEGGNTGYDARFVPPTSLSECH